MAGKSDLPDMGSYNLAMLWIRIGQYVLDQVVAVLITSNCVHGQYLGPSGLG